MRLTIERRPFDPDGRCRDCGAPTKGLPVCDGRSFGDIAARRYGEGPC